MHGYVDGRRWRRLNLTRPTSHARRPTSPCWYVYVYVPSGDSRMRGLYIQHECVPAPPGRARAQPLTFSMTALPKASRCRARIVVRILRKARNKQQLFDGAPRISNIRRCCLFLKIRGDGGGNSVTEPMHPSRPRRAASSGKCIPMLQSSSLPSDDGKACQVIMHKQIRKAFDA